MRTLRYITGCLWSHIRARGGGDASALTPHVEGNILYRDHARAPHPPFCYTARTRSRTVKAPHL